MMKLVKDNSCMAKPTNRAEAISKSIGYLLAAQYALNGADFYAFGLKEGGAIRVSLTMLQASIQGNIDLLESRKRTGRVQPRLASATRKRKSR